MLHAAASAGAARAGQSTRRGNSACAVIARNAKAAMTTTTMRHSVPLLGGGGGGVTVSASASASAAGAASSSLPSHHTLSPCARLAPVVRAAADLGDPYECSQSPRTALLHAGHAPMQAVVSARQRTSRCADHLCAAARILLLWVRCIVVFACT
jgi:hypothetical protein